MLKWFLFVLISIGTIIVILNTSEGYTVNVLQSPSSTVIRVSSYPVSKWIPVAAPTIAPSVTGASGSQSAVGYIMPAAQRSYYYALIDEKNCMSPWSPPVTFDMAHAQGIIFNYEDFVPANPDAIGIIWKTSTGIILANGGNAYGYKPAYYFNPLQYGLVGVQEGWEGYVNHNYSVSSIITEQPPVPKIDRWDVPNIDLEIAYCEVSHTGETELSPKSISKASTFLTMNPNSLTSRSINFYNAPPPYGSLGRHVYARPVGTTTWYRQPAPHCFGGIPLSPDDWLWKLGKQNGCRLYHYRTDVTHAPVAEPKSEIPNLLQARMDVKTQGRVILVDVPEVFTKVPIYDRYVPANLEQNLTVMGEYNQKWKLTQDSNPPAGCVNQGKNWPLLLISNQKSKWKDCTALTKDGWAALTYLEWSGGQCFGNEFHNSSFSGKERGVSMTYESGSAGHTPSEQMFNGCFFSGKIAVEVTGNQTANVLFNGPTYVFGGNSNLRGTAAFLIDTPNSLRFTGDTYFDNGFKGIEMGLTTPSNITFDYVWCDQGHQIFFDGVGMMAQNLTIKGGKLNSWNIWQGKRPFLIRNPCSIYPTTLVTENVQMQQNFGIAKHLKVYSQVHQAFRGRFTNSDSLYNGINLIEPTWEQQVSLGFKLPQFGSNTVNFTLASHSASTITLPDKLINGQQFIDNGQYTNKSMLITGGTGAGSTIQLTTVAGPRQYNIVPTSVPIDNTSQCQISGIWTWTQPTLPKISKTINME